MKKLILVAAAVLGIAIVCQDTAWAQIPQYASGPQTGTGGPTLRRSTRPVVSAYAGLLGSGVGANSGIGYQYFTRVQPQLTAQRALGTLGRSVNRLQAETQSLATNPYGSSSQQQMLLTGTAPGSIGTTGHPVGYLIHTQYFGTNLRSGSSSMSGTSAGTSAGIPAATATGPTTATPVRR